MKLIPYLIFIISISFVLLDCSSSKISNPFNEDYMPLAIGNKWFYSFGRSNQISSTTEIVSIDTMEGKEYFVYKSSYTRPDTNTEYYYYQRISNDTLFSLIYDNQRQRYFERIDAIFSLDNNEVAFIYLDIGALETANDNKKEKFTITDKYSIFDIDTLKSNDGNGIERLPVMKKYSIKVIKKYNDIIELFIDYPGIDIEFTSIYKKGTGLIKSKNGWGLETELVKYELNY